MRPRAHNVGRLTATLLVVCWVAQPLLTIAHAQEHVHRYCPTHQAFEEVSTQGSATRSERLREASALEKLPLAPPLGTLLHEECVFLSLSTRDELTGPAPEVQPVSQACLAVSCPATAPPRPLTSLSVLATAPKASPPAHV
jgi:hypothetical protein